MKLVFLSRYPQPILVLMLTGWLVVLWSVVAWNHDSSERRDIAGSFRQTDTLALLFAQHTTATFRNLDQVLQDLREIWVERPAEVQQRVNSHSHFLSEAILQIATIDAQGLLTYSSLGMPKTPSFLGDREHFKIHQTGFQDKLFVSRPLKDRLTGKWSIQLSRPIFDKGQFAGVIVASVSPDYFVNFYGKAGMGNNGLATMVRDSGEVMVRSSKQDEYVDKVIKPSPYGDSGAPVQGNFRRTSQTDNADRLYSYVRLPDYGLSVLIGPSSEEVLAPVHRQQRQILLTSSAVTVLALLLGWKLMATMRLNEKAQQALFRSEVHLRESHELLEKLSQHVPGMIYQYRLFADGRSTMPYASRGIHKAYGVTLAQVGTNAQALLVHLHTDDQARINASIAESARTLQPWHQEFRINHPHYGQRWHAGHAQPEQLDDASTLWHGFVTDITAIKKQEAALLAANKELETFSYSVAHDLRASLNSIEGFSRLLAKRLGDDSDEKSQRYLARIQASTAQMEQLIADLLVLAQVTRTEMKNDPLDLSTLASNIMDNLQTREPKRNTTVAIEAGLHAWGDAGLMQVVLENLLGNAWKYSSKQTDARISFGQKLDAQRSPLFFVQDNGAGFDMAHAEKLFQPFQRLHGMGDFPGTGIGLATVSRVIARHGGRIWAESAPDLGATFFFSLPIAPRVA